MLSDKKFYFMLYDNILEPLDLQMTYSNRTGIYHSIFDFQTILPNNSINSPVYQWVIMCDQEPLSRSTLSNIWQAGTFLKVNPWSQETGCVLRHDALGDGYYIRGDQYFSKNLQIIATSEHSQEKNNFLKHLDNTYDWYYFYHGFLSLDWFKHVPYQTPITNYTKLFISFNHLFTEKRSYRLNLISRIKDKHIRDQCYLSLDQKNTSTKIKDELFDKSSMLSKESKKLIYQHLITGNTKDLIIDTHEIDGSLSPTDSLNTLSQGLFHVVTETVFYDEKLHLTEKIFKPIVAQRPFMLVAGPGNLAYLKSYGFRTWDRWIDESYDDETDPDLRIIKIVNEMEKLCKKPQWEINKMYVEMRESLEFNFYHFYTDFKKIIVDEMVDNFRRCLIQHNAGRDASMIGFVDHKHLQWHDIKRRLML